MGGDQIDPHFFWSPDAFKRVNVVKWNFLTFPKYQKQKFWTQFEFKFFNPTPSWRGGIKIEVIKKLVRDPMLLNMIFKATKNKNKSRRWVVYLKNWASYGDFCESSRTKSQFLKNSNLKISLSFLDYALNFCMWSEFSRIFRFRAIKGIKHIVTFF